MAYSINEELSDLIFNVINGNELVILVKERISNRSSDIYLIKDGDSAAPTDKNVFSAARTLEELKKITDQTARYKEENKIIIDDKLSASSENPVQNKAIYAVIGNLAHLSTSAKSSLVDAINEAASSQKEEFVNELNRIKTENTTLKENIKEELSKITPLSTITEICSLLTNIGSKL